MSIKPKENIPDKCVNKHSTYSAIYFDLEDGFVRVYNDEGIVVQLERNEWIVQSWFSGE